MKTSPLECIEQPATVYPEQRRTARPHALTNAFTLVSWQLAALPPAVAVLARMADGLDTPLLFGPASLFAGALAATHIWLITQEATRSLVAGLLVLVGTFAALIASAFVTPWLMIFMSVLVPVSPWLLGAAGLMCVARAVLVRRSRVLTIADGSVALAAFIEAGWLLKTMSGPWDDGQLVLLYVPFIILSAVVGAIPALMTLRSGAMQGDARAADA